MNENMSKILVIGGTGNLGKYVVVSSICTGHPTFVLARPPLADDATKKELLETFTKLGVQLIYGHIHDHDLLLNTVKKVDVVISTLGHEPPQLKNQTKIIKAILEAGNIKRFIPSEFGMDAEHTDSVEPAKTMFMIKKKIRQVIRDHRIPYTFVCNNFFQSFFLPRLGQAEVSPPVRDKVSIIGDGDTQAIYNNEQDVATYLIKAVDDRRTLNKILYVRPRENFYSLNQVVVLWEEKTGNALKREYVTEEELLEKISVSATPLNMQLAIAHCSYIKGDQTNFKIDQTESVEATELYPEVGYITVEQFMDTLL